MPALSIRIALDCVYLLIFYSEKFSTDVCGLPYAVNVNLNLSIVKISVNLSRTVVTFRLKNVPIQVTFCKLKLLLLFNQKALLVNVSIL